MNRVYRYVHEVWQGRRAGLAERLLLLLLALPAAAYGLLMTVRSWCYAHGLFAVRRLPRPVISVGNITVGGTGKTPVTAWIARYLLEQGRRVAVLSRGYGGSLEGQEAIVSDGQKVLLTPDQCGDEPYLLASTIPGLMVVIGSDRYLAGMLALKQLAPDCFLLDDGYQHLRLHRDLNLLLMDCANPAGNGRVLPAGPLREPLAARMRADLTILTRCNQETASASIADRLPHCRASHRLVSFKMLVSGSEVQPELITQGRLAAFAGIADPAGFFDSLQQSGIPVSATLALSDHEAYGPATLARLERFVAESGADLLFTTQKDGVKLHGLQVAWLPRVVTAQLELVIAGDDLLKQALADCFETGT